jgi:hypothetical protein
MDGGRKKRCKSRPPGFFKSQEHVHEHVHLEKKCAIRHPVPQLSRVGYHVRKKRTVSNCFIGAQGNRSRRDAGTYSNIAYCFSSYRISRCSKISRWSYCDCCCILLYRGIHRRKQTKIYSGTINKTLGSYKIGSIPSGNHQGIHHLFISLTHMHCTHMDPIACTNHK